MNIVEFALKFKDMASGPLKQFGDQSRSAFSQAKQMAGDLTGRNRALGQSYDEMQKHIKQLEQTIASSTIPSQIRAARRELDSLRAQSAKHPGSTGGGASATAGGGMMGGGMGLANMIGPAAAIAAGYKVASWIGGAIGDGLERTRVQTSFDVLAGGKEAGGTLTKELVDLQKNTILGAEVFKNAQTMLGFGFDSTEVTANMKMLGDVAMGDAEKLNSLTLAFSQVKAGGKLTGGDMLQFINAGFNPLNEIAKSTGKSMGELKDEMSAGNISFAMVQQAFKDATSEGGKFNNMLETIAQTPAGKMAQFSGAWDEFKIKAGTAFQPLLSMALDLGGKLLPIIEQFITPMGEGIAKAVEWMKSLASETGGWMDYLNTVKTLFTDHVLPVVQKLWGYVSSMVGDMVSFIKQSELLKDIFKFVYAVVGAIFEVIGALGTMVKWLWDNVLYPIIKALENAHRWMKGMSAMPDSKTVTANIVMPKAQKAADDKSKSNADMVSEVGKIAAENAKSADAAKSEISGGGPRVLNITVHKFLDTIEISTVNMQETAAEIEQKVSEMFARILAQGATI